MLARASSRVSPWLMQPGITGHSTTKPPIFVGRQNRWQFMRGGHGPVYQILGPGLGGERTDDCRRRAQRAACAIGGTRAGREKAPIHPDRRGGERKRERRRRRGRRRSRGVKERAVGRAPMPAPRQPGPSTRVQCTLQDGPAAGPGPVVRRRFPLGGAGGAVRGAQIARAARAPLPFGDSLKKGGARGGVSRGEGRGGGNGGQSVLARVCVRGPASIELRCRR